jgi:hypothetical protein
MDRTWQHIESGGMTKIEVEVVSGFLYIDVENDNGREVSSGAVRLTMDRAKELKAFLNSVIP